MAAADDREIAYYRAVEDLFATLRGVPHTLSPRDFQLVRTWWREGVPLQVIRTAVTEVFGKRRERGEGEPVVSLAYCRHAVAAHARRHAEMQIGAPDQAPAAHASAATLEDLAANLERSSEELRPGRPLVANVLATMATEVRRAATLPPQMVEEHLFSLESALLDACLAALEPSERESLDTQARRQAASMTAEPEARARMYRALRDRLIREQLELPRLELGA